MFLSKVGLRNYRNFINTSFVFKSGINTILGENGSGKTNLFRAIRLLLDDTMARSAFKLTETDFSRGLKEWRGHWVIISLEFDEVSQDEAIQALFLHGAGIVGESSTVKKSTLNLIFRPNLSVRTRLSELEAGNVEGLRSLQQQISVEDYETVITGRSSADFNNRNTYEQIVGDFDNVIFPNNFDPPEIGVRVPPLLSISKEISFTYVKALRDVVSDFHNNRTNPLLNLLRHKSSEINQSEFQPLVEQVADLNSSIECLSDVNEIKGDIQNTIEDTVGEAFSPDSLSIRSDLSNEAEQLFQSLKLFVSETKDGHEGAIHEMSLGGANLIYLTLKLLEFKYQTRKDPIANFLLIEEPEAHIHMHIQKSLFDRISYPKTQVIYSTHSAHISEASNISNMNVIGCVDGVYQAFRPATNLSDIQVRNVQRYLDAVRSNLLFAKSVILVEGDAEELLIPVLVKKVIGASLDELGISLVNIRSTGFENVATLFHEDRIKKRCSILTDLDSAFFDTTVLPGDLKRDIEAKEAAIRSAKSGLERQTKLNMLCDGNNWLKPFFAQHTFEVDLISCGNHGVFVSALDTVYSDAGTVLLSKTELMSTDKTVYGRRALNMAKYHGKGWFAIALADFIDHRTIIPEYIIDSLVFAHGSFQDGLLHKVLTYRLECIKKYLLDESNSKKASTGHEPSWYQAWEEFYYTEQQKVYQIESLLAQFVFGGVSKEELVSGFIREFPQDSAVSLLRRVQA